MTAHTNTALVTPQNEFTFRSPNSRDGARVHQLISQCPPLDTNSLYCNLLQCLHFADTSLIAEDNGLLAGFISGYRLPQQPDTLFVWQVAVSEQARGKGLASRMLLELLRRQHGAVKHLHTTITLNNNASWQTFRRLAASLNAPLNSQELFSREQHFAGAHDAEHLVHIGPFKLPHSGTSIRPLTTQE
ncbi:diaminobutyrate acetyltransferase [Thalassolituus sp. LLYu03]|uniref:diaminobutyrate acetyltransferase n=1 Tax=Thalassolituus sp. LLYu03 TaxID=3421656 RepID=UPI003D2C142B